MCSLVMITHCNSRSSCKPYSWCMCENSPQISHHEKQEDVIKMPLLVLQAYAVVWKHSVILALLWDLEHAAGVELMPGGKKLVSGELNEEAGKWRLSSIFTH